MCNINILTTSRSRAVVARQAHNLEVDVFKSILRNHDYNRPLWVFFCQVSSGLEHRPLNQVIPLIVSS